MNENNDNQISDDMGLLGVLSIKLTEEIQALLIKDIPQREKDLLEKFLTVLHTGLGVMRAINEGVRPPNLDIDKFTITYADELKNVSEIVRSHPQYTPLS